MQDRDIVAIEDNSLQ